MSKKALNLAQEALHGFIPYLPLNDGAQCGRYDKAITAIKEALAQPEQEPVKFEAVWDSGLTNKDYEDAMRLKRLQQLTTPPQRTWVGLTDEEIALIDWESLVTKKDCVQAIETKIKEKNNG